MPIDMTRLAAAGKDTPIRQIRGPSSIGELIPAVVRPTFRKQHPAAAQLMADWPAIVGPALAASTTPRRFASGTLTLGCAGPIALELQHLAGPLIERINGYLGRQQVQRLRFVQEAARPTPPPNRPLPSARPAPDIPDFPTGPLKDALTALGTVVPSKPS